MFQEVPEQLAVGAGPADGAVQPVFGTNPGLQPPTPVHDALAEDRRGAWAREGRQAGGGLVSVASAGRRMLHLPLLRQRKLEEGSQDAVQRTHSRTRVRLLS